MRFPTGITLPLLLVLARCCGRRLASAVGGIVAELPRFAYVCAVAQREWPNFPCSLHYFYALIVIHSTFLPLYSVRLGGEVG